jgi:hypothetical protein
MVAVTALSPRSTCTRACTWGLRSIGSYLPTMVYVTSGGCGEHQIWCASPAPDHTHMLGYHSSSKKMALVVAEESPAQRDHLILCCALNYTKVSCHLCSLPSIYLLLILHARYSFVTSRPTGRHPPWLRSLSSTTPGWVHSGRLATGSLRVLTTVSAEDDTPAGDGLSFAHSLLSVHVMTGCCPA